MQNSSTFNASTTSATSGSYQTLRISPYLLTTNIFEIQRNLVNIGASGSGNNVNLSIVNGEFLLQDGCLFKVDASSGSTAIAGQATLVGGTIVVNTTSAKTGAIILVSYIGSSLINTGALSTTSIVNNTSFTINSTNVSDVNIVNWWIINNN
jgi:hypothetical protein